MPRLKNLSTLQRGPMFHTRRAILDGQPVVLKHLAEDIRYMPVVRQTLTQNRTNIFYSAGFVDDRPTEHLPALLREEARVIAHAGRHWNHGLLALGCWDEGRQQVRDLVSPAALETVAPRPDLCLVMPEWPGKSLASFSRQEQREMFPALLPSLLRALSRCPHGDLQLSDLIISPDRRRFHLIDPGVRLQFPPEPEGEGDPLRVTHHHLFTTNAANYPFFEPEHGPEPPRARPDSLVEVADTQRQRFFGLEEPLPSGDQPSAADRLAVAILYLRVLVYTIDLAGFFPGQAPLWETAKSDRGRQQRPDGYTALWLALKSGLTEHVLTHIQQTSRSILPEEIERLRNLLR